MKKIILTLLFTLSTMNGSWAATISAQVDRNPVHLDETFNLFFEADDTPDDDPDFSPLKNDFDIINQSQSSNISMINGQISKKIKWTLSVMAKRSGTLTVPAIKFGNDSSASIRLSVKAASQKKSNGGADVFMELDIQPDKVWVQSQFIVTLRFLSAINLSSFSGFSELKTEGVDAIVEKLGEDKQFKTKRGNRPYLVIERRLAVFPQKSGTLSIPPLLAEAHLSGRSSSMFDPFQRGQIKRVRSTAKDIQVLAVPASHTAPHWLPSKEIQLSDEWPENASTYKAGEPITRTLTIMADGLTSAQLPEFKQASIKNIKQYPDKPGLQDIKKDTGIIGIRQEKIAYIPSRAGNYTLPAIEVNWWNTQTGKQETARIAAKTIKVLAGASKPVTLPPPKTTEILTHNIQPNTSSQSFNPWVWACLFFAFGWLMTVILWWWRGTQNTPNPSGQNKHTAHQLSVKQSQQKLKQACDSNQAQACKNALLEWGKTIFPENAPTSLGQLGMQLNDPLKSKLNELEASLYGSNVQSWHADNLYQLIQEWVKSSQTKDKHPSESLEPLYK